MLLISVSTFPDGWYHFQYLREPNSGLIINGAITDTVYQSHHAHRLAQFAIISPEGGMVALNTTHIETFDSNGVKTLHICKLGMYRPVFGPN